MNNYKKIELKKYKRQIYMGDLIKWQL